MVEPITAALTVGPGRFSKKEATAIRSKLTKAKNLAATKNFTASKAVLAQVKLAGEFAAKVAAANDQDVEAKKAAVADLADADSLVTVKTSLE